MNDKEIIELTKQAWGFDTLYVRPGEYNPLITFARLVAKRQQEIDAAICKSRYANGSSKFGVVGEECADLILHQEN
jgi:hypothetical protein